MRATIILPLLAFLLTGCPQRVPPPKPKTLASEAGRVAQLYEVLARVGLMQTRIGEVLEPQR